MPDVRHPGNPLTIPVRGVGSRRPSKSDDGIALRNDGSDAGFVPLTLARAGVDGAGTVRNHDTINDAPTIAFRPNAITRVSAELDINTGEIAGNQFAPTIAGLSSGGFVATWSSVSPIDGSIYGIKAQVFDAGGNKVGNEFLVNTTTDEEQLFSDVTALANGRFVVTWMDHSDTPEGGWRIKARIYNDNGAPVTGEFQVMPNGENGMYPTIAKLASGGFVVAYEANDGIAGQIFDANGNGVGGEFDLHTNSALRQITPVITGLSGGGFVAAWADEDPPSDVSSWGITAQLFDAAGNKVGGDFLVNTVTSSDQQVPAIASLDNGGFVVVWRSFISGGTGRDIRAQLFDAAGARVGGELVVAASTQSEEEPSVTGLPGGGFLVTWTQDPPSGSNPGDSDIRGQIFAADGSPLGAAFAVGPYLPEDQVDSDVTALAGGGFAAVWVAWPEQPGLDQQAFAIRGQVFGGPGFVATAELPYDLKGVIQVDDEDAGAGNLTLTLSVPSGILTVAAGSTGALVSGSGTGTVTVNGTLAQLQALLGSGGDSVVHFTSAAGGPASVNLAVTVNDNGNSGTDPGLSGGPADEQASASIAIAVRPNDPGIARPDTFNTGEAGTVNGNVFIDNGPGQDQDLDGPPLAVAAVNGNAAAVGTQITLPSGALLTLNANGQMIYNTNHAFDSTPSADSGASNSVVTDSFTYTLAGGGTATVTIRITGLDSNDILLDTPGADTLRGGDGNDRYKINNADDWVIESSGRGDDVVQTSVSYALNNSSVETLATMNSQGTDAINISGNGFGQSIFGNEGNNVLLGLGGVDQLVGYGGNDILVGGTGIDYLRGGLGNDVYGIDEGDVIFEFAGEGDDSLAADIGSYFLNAGASIETLSTANQAGTAAQNLTGNELGQTVAGSEGANVLNGGGGNDLLRGYGGADIFLFDTTPGANNHDVIADMQVDIDKIALQNSIVTGLAEGNLGANQFVIGSAAQDADDRIIWNAATNQLFFDADGNGAGAAVLFAIVNGSPNLQASDFLIV